MASRWIGDAGAILLLLAPALAQVSSTADGSLLRDPMLMHATCPGVPIALTAFLHLPVAVVFFRGRRHAAAASLALLYLFLPLYFSVLALLARDFMPFAWLSALLASASVGACLALRGDIDGAASIARLSMGMILVQTHALRWCETGVNPLAVSPWTGILGGLLLAAGELIASRRPASSASASRPCPLPSSRTSWRRA